MNINEVSSGITHIEDLEINDFVKTLETISEHTITEKVDGAQMLFGLDEHGFYTSRESKGGRRTYSNSDYPVNFSSTYKRLAHSVLESVLPTMKRAGLQEGDQVEVEVVYGELPNVVQYSPSLNHIIFLRTTAGSININKLKNALVEKQFITKAIVPYTTNGKDIKLREETNNWQFNRSPILSINEASFKLSMAPHINRIRDYLSGPSGISGLSRRIVEATALSAIPHWCDPQDWKTTKPLLKTEKEIIRSELTEIKMQAKVSLIKETVQGRCSSFGPLISEGGWIEGIVLSHNVSNKAVKIIDKTKFGVIHKESWAHRNSLTESARSATSSLSVMGDLRVKLATALGHPELGTIHAKRYLKKSGTITEDRVTNLTNGTDIKSVKSYWTNILEAHYTKLECSLNKYMQDYVATGSVTKLSEAIKKRTLEEYAIAFQQTQKMLNDTLLINSPTDLLNVIVKKQLGSI